MHFVRIKHGLPLLPAKIISSSKYKEETLNCKENHCIACQHQATGSPFDLKHKRIKKRIKSLLYIVLFANILFSASETTNEILNKTAKKLNNVIGRRQWTIQ